MSIENTIKVWDPLVRILHWLLVISFVTAYLTHDNYIHLHACAGYLLTVVIFIRIAWGFIGSQHALFGNFIASPGKAIQYILLLRRNNASRYIGHNPAGGFMILIMLITLCLLSVTGLIIYAAAEQAGPLAFWFTQTGDRFDEGIESIHECLADLMLALIFIHLAGVFLESHLHGENLIRAMIHGYKRAKQESQSY